MRGFSGVPPGITLGVPVEICITISSEISTRTRPVSTLKIFSGNPPRIHLDRPPVIPSVIPSKILSEFFPSILSSGGCITNFFQNCLKYTKIFF